MQPALVCLTGRLPDTRT